MADKILSGLEKKIGSGRIRVDEQMKGKTTLRIGGPAQYYIEVTTEEDLIRAVKAAYVMDIPVTLFGGGSNLLVSDRGIEGLVIKNNCRALSVLNTIGKMKNEDGEWKMNRESVVVSAQAGALMNQLVRFTVEEGLRGLEDQLGLPGTVGGGVAMNACAAELSTFVGDSVYKARILTRDGEIKEVDRSYFRFTFGKSYLLETGEFLLTVFFLLTPGDKKMLWEKATKALTYRTHKMPKGNAYGCTFRNMTDSARSRIATPANIPSLADLIGKAGLDGKRVGDAVVYAAHPNFIINAGNASSQDIVSLCDVLKKEIKKKLDIDFWLEMKQIGKAN